MKKGILFILILFNLVGYSQFFKNYSSIELSNDEKTIGWESILDDYVNNYDLIVMGEEHYSKANWMIQFSLFKYLHDKKKVKYLLIEYGESRAILINQYFRTGKIDILKNLSIVNFDYLLYQKLKEYYDSLPSDNKFKVHGVDYEKEGVEKIEFAILKIIDAVDDNELSEHTLNFLKNSGKDYFNGEALDTIMVFLSELEKEPSKYKKEFGEYFEDLLALYRALKVDVKGVKYRENSFHPLIEKREILIYNQVVELKKRYVNDKFFCIFGTAHITLEKHEDWAKFVNYESFITKLNTYADSPFNSKILSILPLYKSCIPRWKKSYVKKHIGLNKIQINELDQKSKGNLFTLFEYPKETEEQKKFRKEYYQMILINRF